MHKIFRLSVIAIMLVSASISRAGDLKVFVSPFQSKPDDDKLASAVSVISSREVLRTRGFEYISPSQYISIVTGGKVPANKIPEGLGSEYDKKTIEALGKAFEPYQRNLVAALNSLGAADIILGGGVSRNGNLIRVEAKTVDSSKFIVRSAAIECTEEALSDEVTRAIRELLRKALEPERVSADRFIDPKESIVAYVVMTEDARELTIRVDYTQDRPDPKVMSVNILPPKSIKNNGDSRLAIVSEGGRPVYITFGYKAGELDSVKADADAPEPAGKGEQTGRFTVKSSAGYLLDFDFSWKDGKVENVTLMPRVNAFNIEEYEKNYLE